GPDLVRLALERAQGALQAVDLLTDLTSRHGQVAGPGEPPGTGCGLLLADRGDAFILAVCGRHWALQEIGQVRALGEVCHIRKDWDRISRGLADLAGARGWWECDGSKLDFAGAVCEPGVNADALRRWGQATLSLEQHSGEIDRGYLRRLLA